MSDITARPPDNPSLLKTTRPRVRHAHTRAVMAVDAEPIGLYGDIGAPIDPRRQQQGRGAAAMPCSAIGLHHGLREQKSFSERNIKRMLAFYRAFPHLVPQPTALLPADQPVGRSAYTPAHALAAEP